MTPCPNPLSMMHSNPTYVHYLSQRLPYFRSSKVKVHSSLPSLLFRPKNALLARFRADLTPILHSKHMIENKEHTEMTNNCHLLNFSFIAELILCPSAGGVGTLQSFPLVKVYKKTQLSLTFTDNCSRY